MTSMLSRVAGALVRSANSPVSYAANQFSVLAPPTGGMTRALKTTSSVGTLFAIVDRLSTSTSKIEWKLWRKSATGDKRKRVEVTRHWALDVWRKPNAFMVQSMFVETYQQHMDLTGEGWWVIQRDPRTGDLPIGMWPVRPDRLEPIPHPLLFISHYEYTAPNGQKVRLELNEVIFIKKPNPDDPYRGLGPVQSILMDLDANRYSAEWNRNFFINGAEPGGIIKAPTRLDDDQFTELQERWDEQHRGVANAHRVAILEGMEWIDRKFSQRDMQFVELRGVSRDVIREAYGIPKFALGDVDDVNRASADASAAWFNEALTVPRLDRIKDALNHQFLPLFRGTEDLEFDYESPVESDYERENATLIASTDSWVKLVQAGVDPKDASKICGLPEDMKYEKPEPPALPAPPPGQEGEEGAQPPPPGNRHNLPTGRGVSRPK